MNFFRRMSLMVLGGFGAIFAADSAAQARFDELEKLLLEADSLQLVTHIKSGGQVPSRFEGTLLLQKGDRARLDQNGAFMGQPARAHLVSDGSRMKVESAQKQSQADNPKALNEGLIIGFTRMGLLHNIAVISSGALPEGTDGTTRDWIQVSQFTALSEEVLNGVESEKFGFNITVSGQPAGEATLWLRKDNGLPLQREQTVYFEGGSMTVVESYPLFERNPKLAAARFSLEETAEPR